MTPAQGVRLLFLGLIALYTVWQLWPSTPAVNPVRLTQTPPASGGHGQPRPATTDGYGSQFTTPVQNSKNTPCVNCARLPYPATSTGDRVSPPSTVDTPLITLQEGDYTDFGYGDRLPSPATVDGYGSHDKNPCSAQILGATAGEGEIRVSVAGSADKLHVYTPQVSFSVATPEVCSAGQCVVQLSYPGPYHLSFDTCRPIVLGGTSDGSGATP